MPENRLSTENPPPRRGVFPVPNALVDALLPTLKDTELRVLLLVLRQTWGWTDPGTGRPKARDRLTHGRLRRDTGRAGEAVSAAVDALVRRGLVVAEDEKGTALATPSERRRAGSLYFLPGTALTAKAPVEGATETLIGRKTEVRKPKTTKDRLDKNTCPLRKPEDGGRSPNPVGRQRSSDQESPVRKPSEEGLTADQMARMEATKRLIRARLARLARG